MPLFLRTAIIFFVLWGVVGFFVGSTAVAVRFLSLPQESAAVSEPNQFVILEGESAQEIAARLEEEGIVRSRFSLLFHAFMNKKTGDFRAGTYQVSPSMSPIELLTLLTDVTAGRQDIWITIPEGFTITQIDDRLAASGLIGGPGIFEEADIDISRFSWLLNWSIVNGQRSKVTELEGYLFPDTYRFKKGSTVQEIAGKLLENFEQKMTPELRSEITRQGKSLHEIVTMASLVEEEVRTLEDRRIVSGILWKRLVSGVPLQVDATVLYAVCRRPYAVCEKDKKLLYSDLEVDSPYNTYKYKGLPPGPIANPGLESIRAAVYPEESEYWYYLSKPDGETVFSKTLEEHNRAKALYLR